MCQPTHTHTRTHTLFAMIPHMLISNTCGKVDNRLSDNSLGSIVGLMKCQAIVKITMLSLL